MTKKIKTFDSKDEMYAEVKKLHKDGFVTLHKDLINNKWRLTSVNGTDDPNNLIDNSKFLRRKELQSKLNDNSIVFEELKELLRR